MPIVARPSMTLEQILQQRYTVAGRLPAFSATHQRYELHGTGGTGERFVLSFCDYPKAISAAAVARQREVGTALARPVAALLCRAVECRFEREFQAVISEFPGEVSLRELLQEKQALQVDEVEAFLRLLTEAAEAAVQHGWPRLTLDAGHLFLDKRLGLPRIPTPDVPAFDASAGPMPEFDPMQTMQFNAADLRQTSDPIPKDTRDYVAPLAALGCDLLGQPQAVRGGNARYQPVPQFTSQQNVLLRRALTGESRAGFPSARSFIDEFFGVSLQQDLTSHTECLRSLTATVTKSESRLTTPVPASALTVRLPQVAAKPAEAPTAPITVREADAGRLASLTPAQRIRLVPETDETPVFSLAADEWLLLGRNAGDADFVAQFRPRSSVNDARTRRISRVQARVKMSGLQLEFEEKDMLNPSTYRDTPVGPGLKLTPPALVMLGGEYPLELHRMKSDYKEARVVQGRADWTDASPLQGAMVARPGGPGVLLWEAALIQSDVGLHFSQSGRPWLRVDGNDTAAARIHHFRGQFWLETLDDCSVKTEDGSVPAVHEALLLHPGTKVFIGHYAYAVQAVTLGKPS